MRVEVAIDPGPPLRAPLWPALGPAHLLPRFPQYWAPLVAGTVREGRLTIDGEEHDLAGARAYGEKSWGPHFPPDGWWWGAAHAFEDPALVVAFAGGPLLHGLAFAPTAIVARVRAGLVRLGSPPLRPVRTTVGEGTWHVEGRGPRTRVRIEGHAEGAHLLLPHPEPDDGTFDRRAEHWLDGVVDAGGRGPPRWALADAGRRARRRSQGWSGAGRGSLPWPPTRPWRALAHDDDGRGARSLRAGGDRRLPGDAARRPGGGARRARPRAAGPRPRRRGVPGRRPLRRPHVRRPRRQAQPHPARRGGDPGRDAGLARPAHARRCWRPTRRSSRSRARARPACSAASTRRARRSSAPRACRASASTCAPSSSGAPASASSPGRYRAGRRLPTPSSIRRRRPSASPPTCWSSAGSRPTTRPTPGRSTWRG